MMPSACTKPDQKTSSEVSDPMIKAIQVIEKKVRNLEKRKGKLDGYREKLDKGQGLNEDQRDAITKYDWVVQNLEFARELQKQFLSINTEAEKLNRRQLKKDKLERQSQDVSRIKELLQLQGLLDSMGSDSVRKDFLTGSQGAVALSEKNLDQLDELYKLISPTRDGETSYSEQLNAAAEHMSHFLDMKDKEVIGTTYKDLHQLVDQIQQCGYFDTLATQQEEEADAAAPTEEVSVEEEIAEVVSDSPLPDFDTQSAPALDMADNEVSDELSQSAPALAEQQSVSQTVLSLQQPGTDSSSSLPQGDQTTAPQSFEGQDSFFSTASNFPRQRPVQEILSSVQGTYDFLQESHVDVDSPAHLDPAVVAAHPMAPQSSEGNMTSHGYQSGLLSTEDQTTPYQSAPSQFQTGQYQAPSSHVAQPCAVEQTLQAEQSNLQSESQYAEHLASQHDSQTSSYIAQQSALESTYTTESYGQNLIGTSLQSSAQHSFGEQTSSLATQISSHNMEQSMGMSAGESAGPQPIPLPSQVLPGQSLTHQTTYSNAADNSSAYDTAQSYSSATDSSQSYVSATETSQTSRPNSDSEEKKQPFLNPNADMFRPAAAGYSQQPEAPISQADVNFSQTAPASSTDQDPKSYNQATAAGFQTDYQPSTNYSTFEGSNSFRGSGYAGNRNTRGDVSTASRTGNQSRETSAVNRGRGGGAGSSSGMINNGYQRTGRGAATYTNTASRGGYNNGNRSANSGGNRNNYQGFPSRQDYRPEGYQGYGNNSFNSFSKGARGGGSGAGAPRGNQRSSSGGMRSGGPARNNNNMRGNSQGGSSGYRSSFGRPGSAGSSMPNQ